MLGLRDLFSSARVLVTHGADEFECQVGDAHGDHLAKVDALQSLVQEPDNVAQKTLRKRRSTLARALTQRQPKPKPKPKPKPEPEPYPQT